MDEILEILAGNGRATAEDIARMTGQDVDTVVKAIRKYEKDGTILGYRAMINQELVRDERTYVRALIEVSVTPQKDVGFDAVAERIYSFDEVKNKSYILIVQVLEPSNVVNRSLHFLT